jgi:hypothetical protein
MSPRRPVQDDLDGARGLAYGTLIGVGTWLLAFAGLALLMGGCAMAQAAADFSYDLILSDTSEWESPAYNSLSACEAAQHSLIVSSSQQTIIPGAALPVVGNCGRSAR